MFLSVLLAILVASAALYVYRMKNRRYYELLDKIPSPPRPLPLLGHLPLLFSVYKNLKPGERMGAAYFNFQVYLASKFGSKGIIHLDTLIDGNLVIILKPEMYRDILSDANNLKKSRMYKFADFIGTDNILLQVGTQYERTKAIMSPAFTEKALSQFQGKFNKWADKLVQKLMIEKSIPDSAPLISRFILRAFLETSLGIQVTPSIDPEIDEYLKAIEEYGACLTERMMTPWLRNDTIYSLSALGRRRTRAIETVRAFSERAIRKRMEVTAAASQGASGAGTCLADTLIKAHREDGENVPFAFIRRQLDGVIMAGYDSTSGTLTKTLLLIAIHEPVQQQLHRLLVQKFKGKKIGGGWGTEAGAEITAEDASSIPYLNAVISESQRVIPPVSALGREVVKEISVGGYTLPVGCTILFNIYSLHHDGEHFEDPEIFDPNRFLNDPKPGTENPGTETDPNQLKQRKGKHGQFSFMPFSHGRRKCMGSQYALREIRVFIIKLLLQFKLSTGLRMQDLKLTHEMTLNLVNKVDMKFTPREEEEQ